MLPTNRDNPVRSSSIDCYHSPGYPRVKRTSGLLLLGNSANEDKGYGEACGKHSMQLQKSSTRCTEASGGVLAIIHEIVLVRVSFLDPKTTPNQYDSKRVVSQLWELLSHLQGLDEAEEGCSFEAAACDAVQNAGQTGSCAPEYYRSWTFSLAINIDGNHYTRPIRLILIEQLNGISAPRAPAQHLQLKASHRTWEFKALVTTNLQPNLTRPTIILISGYDSESGSPSAPSASFSYIKRASPVYLYTLLHHIRIHPNVPRDFDFTRRPHGSLAHQPAVLDDQRSRRAINKLELDLNPFDVLMLSTAAAVILSRSNRRLAGAITATSLRDVRGIHCGQGRSQARSKRPRTVAYAVEHGVLIAVPALSDARARSLS